MNQGFRMMEAEMIALIRLVPVFLSTLFGAAYAQGLSAELSVEVRAECSESGDFIRNIAHARNSGKLKRAFAIERLNDDYQIIHSFHPNFRWFAHDKDDEDFLRSQVAAVFDKPVTPDEHHRRAVQTCVNYKLLKESL